MATNLHRKLTGLNAGDTVTIRYSFATAGRGMHSVKFRTLARGNGQNELVVHFERAEVRVSPLGEGIDEPRFVSKPQVEVARKSAEAGGG